MDDHSVETHGDLEVRFIVQPTSQALELWLKTIFLLMFAAFFKLCWNSIHIILVRQSMVLGVKTSGKNMCVFTVSRVIFFT